MSTSVAGYTSCVNPACGAFVLNEIAYKTRGHCAECFRANANEILEGALTVVAGREKLVLRTRTGNRSPGDRKQRKNAKARARQTEQAKDRHRRIQHARLRADIRMRAIFPELWEVILADERAKLGLDAWTIDKALTPGDSDADFAFLSNMRRLQ